MPWANCGCPAHLHLLKSNLKLEQDIQNTDIIQTFCPRHPKTTEILSSYSAPGINVVKEYLLTSVAEGIQM